MFYLIIIVLWNLTLLLLDLILKLFFVNWYNKSKIAKITNTHRNTVRHIINLFKEKADNFHYQLINSNLSSNSIIQHFSFLSPKSRKPYSNKRSASYQSTKFIIYLFLASNFWCKKLSFS